MSPRQEPETEDFPVLQNKGSLWILMALGKAGDGLTFKEIKSQSHLSHGTTQRRLDELEEHGWVTKKPVHNEAGQPVNKFYLSEQSTNTYDDFKELGKSLLDMLSGTDDN